MGIAVNTFNNGEVIINEGDVGKSIFRLVEGNADVIADYGKKEPFRLGILRAGDYFGEMAIFEECPRSATVVAASTTVRVLEIPEDELNGFLKENPDVIGELIDHLGNKVYAMTNDYNEAQALLKSLRDADAGKKKSLFSKIKKHIDHYQSGKNEVSEPDVSVLSEVFASIPHDGAVNFKSYDKGEVIFYEGDTSDSMYILHSGNVRIYTGFGKADEQLFSELPGGSAFGVKGLIAGEPMKATAVAESDETVVEKIYKDELEYIFKTCPAKVTFILRYLSCRLRRLNIDFYSICKEITNNYQN